ncbi:MAG: hypothetical protein KAG53_08335 [Endozoicomonadaceae bacterium]|nr:hypothetical protein [Endozoicomonadaceae bacterium]
MNYISTTIPISTSTIAQSNLSLTAARSQGRRVSSEAEVSTMSSESQGATGGQTIPSGSNVRNVFKIRVNGYFTRMGEYKHATDYRQNSGCGGTPSFNDLMNYLREEKLTVDEINYVLNSSVKGYNPHVGQGADRSFADSMECKFFIHELNQIKRILCGRRINLNNSGLDREEVRRHVRNRDRNRNMSTEE